eukprot:jgi/Mesen1/10700/ME000090S10159
MGNTQAQTNHPGRRDYNGKEGPKSKFSSSGARYDASKVKKNSSRKSVLPKPRTEPRDEGNPPRAPSSSNTSSQQSPHGRRGEGMPPKILALYGTEEAKYLSAERRVVDLNVQLPDDDMAAIPKEGSQRSSPGWRPEHNYSTPSGSSPGPRAHYSRVGPKGANLRGAKSSGPDEKHASMTRSASEGLAPGSAGGDYYHSTAHRRPSYSSGGIPGFGRNPAENSGAASPAHSFSSAGTGPGLGPGAYHRFSGSGGGGCPVMHLGDFETGPDRPINVSAMHAQHAFPFSSSAASATASIPQSPTGSNASDASFASSLSSRRSKLPLSSSPERYTQKHHDPMPLPPRRNSGSSSASHHAASGGGGAGGMMPPPVAPLDSVFVSPLTGAAIYPAPDDSDAARAAAVAAELADELEAVLATEKRLRRLLDAIGRVNQVYLQEQKPAPVFNALLSILLEVTESAYGFISSVHENSGGLYMKVQAITNISWTSDLAKWYEKAAPKGLVFSNMRSLFGEVISNDPETDPRAGGLPEGHPRLHCFLGMPLMAGGEFIGMLGVANRSGGYSEALESDVQPLTMTIAQMIYAFEQRRRRLDAEVHLASVIQVCVCVSHPTRARARAHACIACPVQLLLVPCESGVDGGCRGMQRQRTHPCFCTQALVSIYSHTHTHTHTHTARACGSVSASLLVDRFVWTHACVQRRSARYTGIVCSALR